jgi:6-phosphogluconolactonase (cycloisomerase 2 family)
MYSKTAQGTSLVTILVVAACMLSACGGGGDAGSPTSALQYTVGGAVSGLASSTSVVLQDNGTDTITVSSNSSFTFPVALTSGTRYNVTVMTQPSGQTCSLNSASGSIVTSNVTSVAVSCAVNAYAVGGSVSGLASGTSVTLQDNGADSLSVSSIGSFVFSSRIATGNPYNVTVTAQPQGQTCSVSSGAGTVSGADVTSIKVGCVIGAAGTSIELLYSVYGGAVGGISAFTVDTTSGALSRISGSPFATAGNQYSVAVDPKSRFVYVTGNAGSSVDGFAIDPQSGALTAFPGSPAFADGNAGHLAIDPSGKFLYTTNNGTNNLSAFAIDASGTLTKIGGSPFVAGSQPWAIAVDPQGSFVFVGNQGDDTISVYHIDPSTGALAAVAGSPFATGSKYTVFLAVDPSGSTLYAANRVSDDIAAFSIDRNSGALSAVLGSPYSTGSGALAVLVDRSGKFVYVATGSNVVLYSREVTTGALTAGSSGPYLPATSAMYLAIEHSGKFLYVLENLPQSLNLPSQIHALSIDSTSGALTTVTGSPFAAASNTGATGIAASW